MSEQHRYNLLTRLPELEVLSAAAGARALGQKERAEKLRPQLEAYAAVCRELGERRTSSSP